MGIFKKAKVQMYEEFNKEIKQEYPADETPTEKVTPKEAPQINEEPSYIELTIEDLAKEYAKALKNNEDVTILENAILELSCVSKRSAYGKALLKALATKSKDKSLVQDAIISLRNNGSAKALKEALFEGIKSEFAAYTAFEYIKDSLSKDELAKVANENSWRAVKDYAKKELAKR